VIHHPRGWKINSAETDRGNAVVVIALAALGPLAVADCLAEAQECRGPRHQDGETCPGASLAPLDLGAGVLVAHALGGIDGLEKTNTREALAESLNEGKSWYEVDISRTRDDVLVCVHPSHLYQLFCDAPEDAPAEVAELDAADLLSRRFEGSFTPMSFDELLSVMDEHPEIQVITDTQGLDEAMARAIGDLLTSHPGAGERLVPQIYRPQDASLFEQVRSAWPFPFEILTLYQWTEDPDVAIAALETLPNVRMVVMWDDLLDEHCNRTIHDAGRLVGVHTVNDPGRAAELRADGADVIYTDTLCGPTLP
jgi:glycerophosphoryl diester phosphodiesterase